MDLFSDQNPPAVGPNTKRHRCDPQPNFKCPLPWRIQNRGPEIQQYPSTNQCIQTQPSGPFFTRTPVSQRKAYTYTRTIPPFLRGICGHPFHLRDAAIDRHAPECCAARLPDCNDLFGPSPTRPRPRTPMCAWLFGSAAPSDANCVNSHIAPCWACLACGTLPSHICSPSRPPPGGLHPTRLCRRAIWSRRLHENGIRGRYSSPHTIVDVTLPTAGEKLGSTLPSTCQVPLPTKLDSSPLGDILAGSHGLPFCVSVSSSVGQL